MKILATAITEEWDRQRELAKPFGIDLQNRGATASEPWFTAYFKSGRDNTVDRQEADIVLVATDIAGTPHSLILDLTKQEAQALRRKCNLINELRGQMDDATQLADFAAGDLVTYINTHI